MSDGGGLPDDLPARIEAAAEAAGEALVAWSAGRSLCEIGRRHAGGGPESLKAIEGRYAALREARRGIRQAAESGRAEAFHAVLARWRRDLVAHEASGRDGAWVAYARGGVEALLALEEPRAQDGAVP